MGAFGEGELWTNAIFKARCSNSAALQPRSALRWRFSPGDVCCLAWWILLGAGLAELNGWFGWTFECGYMTRRICLEVGFSIYYVRILFTEFVFLTRGIGWNEVFTIAPWLLIIVLVLRIAGGTNDTPPGAWTVAGITLFVLGSWMNSYAEHARHVWKQKPENKGHLYVGGLFRFSRHPDYFGDLLSSPGSA